VGTLAVRVDRALSTLLRRLQCGALEVLAAERLGRRSFGFWCRGPPGTTRRWWRQTGHRSGLAGTHRPGAVGRVRAVSQPRAWGGRLRSCPPPKVPGGPWAPPLLRCVGHPMPAAHLLLVAHDARTPRCWRSGRWGALRSEVKEERRAKPVAGDMSAAECPAGPITCQGTHAMHNECQLLIDGRQPRALVEAPVGPHRRHANRPLACDCSLPTSGCHK